jgi:AraC-like DNA-binding protein
MILYIKNMVCSRCIMVVKSELEILGIRPISIKLGEIEIQEIDIDYLKESLITKLQSLGLELLDDKQSKTIERIKNLIVELVHYQNNNTKYNLSDYLTQNILQDYNTLSHLFSEVEGITIEKYFIKQKIEKVKELLSYDELTLSEIANQLHYSSLSHLSNQFKKNTGFTSTFYKNMKEKNRKEIDHF